jgi:hypothetical protein
MQRNLILCNLYKKWCIKLISIKELYYDAQPTKSQDLHCKTSKTDIPLQGDQNKFVQKQCGHLVQQNMQD